VSSYRVGGRRACPGAVVGELVQGQWPESSSRGGGPPSSSRAGGRGAGADRGLIKR
jgi:hypothetical protein